MKNSTKIIIVNIISATPILFFPVVFLMLVMSYHNGSFTDSLTTYSVLGYPLFIIAFIVASQIKKSLKLALVGLIPALFLCVFTLPLFAENPMALFSILGWSFEIAYKIIFGAY